MHGRPFVGLLSVAALLAVTTISCRRDGTPEDFAGMEMKADLLPNSPTNSFASDPEAANFGRTLFFDPGFSSEGTIACVHCHNPSMGFSDPRPRSIGVRGQTGDRHAMPITDAAFHPFLLWDGKADSAWLQPLKAIENPKEMDFSRTEVAHRVATVHRDAYEGVFGELPDLSAIPPRAMPGDPSWDTLSDGQRDDVQRVFVNVGKAIEAYERRLLCENTRFDHWMRGELELSDAEAAGAGTFHRAGCARCHSGPSFSDGAFHNIGVPDPDRGRVVGAAAVLDDALNGGGRYSDDPAAGQRKLDAIANEQAQEGAFRTPSLRGVGQRRFFGHAAHQETLRGFIADIYRRGGRGGRGGGGGRPATVGTLDPQLAGVNVPNDDLDDLVAFLHTLDCPTPAPEWLAPTAPPSAATLP